MTIPEKRPFFVEFLGTPEAGKTTVIRPIASILQKQGYKVKVLSEAAEQIPVGFPRGTLSENIWIRLKTVNQVLEASVSDFDIILVDRGIIDTCIWNEIGCQKKELSKTLCDEILPLFKQLNIFPDLCIALHVPAEISIQRRHGEGRIVTRKFVEYFNSVVFEYLEKVETPQFKLDTSNITPKECTEIVTQTILEHFA
jgi:thymidylate kinase